MKIVEKQIAALRSAEYNPRKISDAQRKHLMQSIKDEEMLVPIIVNIHRTRKNVIIAGHQRVMVAKELGWERVPCIEVSRTLEQEKALNVKLNKIGGEFDMKKLAENFNIADLLNFGFTKKELNFDVDDLLADGDDKKPAANVETLFQFGDVRFTVSQDVYNKWYDELAKIVGMKKHKQVDEVMKRLKIEKTKT
jgi:ParB-like chromosome segregation protein Spo0J